MFNLIGYACLLLSTSCLVFVLVKAFVWIFILRWYKKQWEQERIQINEWEEDD